jgi:hypothetical protein
LNGFNQRLCDGWWAGLKSSLGIGVNKKIHRKEGYELTLLRRQGQKHPILEKILDKEEQNYEFVQ